MKKVQFFILFFIVCISLTGFYPNQFFGSEIRGPVTKYENSIVQHFGTYRKETVYKYRAQRLNSLDENYKIIRKKIYNGYPWNNFALEFNSGNEYLYNNEAKLEFINIIDEENNFMELSKEFMYYQQVLKKIIDYDFYYSYSNWEYHYGHQSAYAVYNNSDGELCSSRLITYIYGQQGFVTGWVGRNYDLNSDYYGIGSFAYDEEHRIVWYRYETPADKEHILYEGNFEYDDDKLVTIDYGNILHQLEYDELSRIVEINIYDNNGALIKSYYYEYDENGRIILETEESYCNDSLSRINVYEYEYNEFVTDIDTDVIEKQSTLLKNYPNPFNPSTKITFSLEKEQEVELTIFNVKGQKIKTLLRENRQTGTHHIQWDGTNEKKQAVSSGIYLYQLKTESQTLSKRMLLLK